jgi:PAS domain S-box-containing protein
MPERLKELVAVNRAIAGTLDYEEVLRLVVEKTRRLARAESCVLIIADEHGIGRIASSSGVDEEVARSFSAPLSKSIDGRLRRSLGYGSSLIFLEAPVRKEDSLIGVLGVYRETEADPITEFLLSALADQASIALQHARRHTETKRLTALLEAIFSNTTSCLSYLDRDLRFVEANSACCAAVGRCREDVIGKRHVEVLEDPRMIQALEKVRETGEEASCRETPGNHAEDSHYWDWSVRAVKDEDGRLVGVVVSGADVTGKVSTRKQLEEADRLKNRFLAMLAHELRNPLAAISNAAEILHHAPLEEPIFKRSLQIVERQTEHMARLLGDVTDVTRAARGKIQLERETIDLRSVVHEAISCTRSMFEAKQQTLHLSLPDSPIYIYADGDRLHQVVANLLSNATSYTQDSGDIWLGAATDGERAEITVRDNGSGLSREELNRVFDMFVQAEGRPTGTGLGLGLTIVQQLVALHGGSVDARSEGKGHGTEFTVTLPLTVSEEVEERREDRGRLEPNRLATRRVLVVDDDPDVADTLSILLEEEGHEIVVAPTGEKALQIAREMHPDVVLLDLGLPDMNGSELPKLMSQQSAPGEPPPVFVALTGYAGTDVDAEIKRAGIKHHLTKPVDMNTLREVLAMPHAAHPGQTSHTA